MSNKKFLLLVSTAAISLSMICTSKANAASPEVKRIWGNDRYETCSKVVEEGWKSESKYAVIVNGENFPDALSASVLAKKYNAPILLTECDKLDDKTYNELKRLKVKKVFIVGGSGVIKSNVEDTIHNMNIDTQRFSGDDRNGTSAAVANEIGTENGVILAAEDNFTDALSIAPIAAKFQMPIILMPKDKIPSSVEGFMVAKNIPKTYIIGGKDIISEDVALQFPKVQRIEGNDTYERNINIINTFTDKLDLSNVYIAYSEKFPDALSGSAFAALNGNPIVLMGDTTNVNTKYFFNSEADKIKTVTVLGGTAGVKDSQLQSIFNTVSFNSNGENTVAGEEVENNGSSVVKQGDWIYYSGNKKNTISGDAHPASELYRIKNDETTPQKLSNDFAQKMWIKDDYIYYINYQGLNQKSSFYRMKEDGTERQQITSDVATYVNFEGDYIYYVKYDKTDVDNFRIYKIQKNGIKKEPIGKEHGMYLQIKDDWIYYSNIDDESKIYRMKKDGSEKQLICKNSAANYMNIVGDYIYYCNNDDYNSLYRIKIDGTEGKKLNSDNSRNINILGDYIYYAGIDEDDKGSLYKMKLDGSEKKMLSNIDCASSVEVHNDYIYCCGFKSKGIYKVKTDGTGYENISANENIISLQTVGYWIYYVRFNAGDMSYSLYKMKLDGSSDQRVE